MLGAFLRNAVRSSPCTSSPGQSSFAVLLAYSWLPQENCERSDAYDGQFKSREAFMNPKLIVAILVIAAVPVCAQAQPTPATKADAQNVFKIISGDKAKTEAFCAIGKLGDQMEQANAKKDSKKVEELSLKADEMGKTLGPEYAALMDGIGDVDPDSEVGQEISSIIQALDKLCAK